MVLVNMFTIATSVSKYYKLEGGIIVSRQMSNVSTISWLVQVTSQWDDHDEVHFVWYKHM
jgi:hypothetical protein